jgi:hypothetical protein
MPVRRMPVRRWRDGSLRVSLNAGGFSGKRGQFMASTSVVLTMLLDHGSTEAKSGLDHVKTVVDIIGTAITGVAVIAGGIWAYFKFAKGRTFRPRLEVDLSGQWRRVGSWQRLNRKQLLQARIRVKNIGASKVTLLQRGTGLRVSVLAASQPPPPAPARWDSQRVFVILKEHSWIEPGETVSDDLLLDLGTLAAVPTLFEARLVWRRRRRNIVVSAREIISTDAKINGDKE